MHRKYEKTYRILVPQINIIGKHFLTDEQTDALLDGEVILCEKLDGANTAIIRTEEGFQLQKRGGLIGEGEHPQFQFFKSWAQANYLKIMDLPVDVILYGELCYCVHTVKYDALPDYFLAFAYLDTKTNTYMHRDTLVETCELLGFSCVPEIARGVFKREELFDRIPKVSNYGHNEAEGLVVWNYTKGLRGKVVREKFVKDMEEDTHWIKHQIEVNGLKK